MGCTQACGMILDDQSEIITVHKCDCVEVEPHNFWKHDDEDGCGQELERALSIESAPCMPQDRPATERVYFWMKRTSHDMDELEERVRTEFRMAYFAKPNETESKWQRFARKLSRAKQCQLDMFNGRLESEGVLEAELKKDGPRAFMNYAHFHGTEPGSTNIAECPLGAGGANICNVVLSSAGFRGWATAKVGLPEIVMTIHASGMDARDMTKIICTSAAGNATIVEVTTNSMVEEFHADLANKLHVRADLLRLVLPNSSLLEESDHGKYLLDLLDEAVLALGMQASQLLTNDSVHQNA